MKFILGKKIGMTQVFRDDGTVVPVTKIEAGPCIVTQIKTAEKDGVSAVQIGFGEQKKFRLSRAVQGHLNGLALVRYLRDFRAPEEAAALKRGDAITLNIFAPGDRVQVTGRSKGKGFQGVVKRHGFRGGPRTHGHKDNLRMPGTIGAGGVQRVFKNQRMGGHMGDEQVTVKNLEIVQVDPATNLLYVKGAVPGARGSLLMLSSDSGTITVELPTIASEAATE
jgi:large subunit ribosomal protein L3